MRERLESLAIILEKMNGLYERVLVVMQKEKTALIQLDYDALYIEMREKDELLALIRSLDKDRLRIQDQYALVTDRDVAAVSLRLMGEELSGKSGEAARVGARLLALRTKLEITVGELARKNETNRYFIEKCLHNMRLVAENYATAVRGRSPDKTAQKATVYGGNARMSKKAGQSGTLLEKKG